MVNPPQRMREGVLGRDEYHCLGCGQDVRSARWWSLQHRVARGTGGGNTYPNLITLCGSATTGCHWLCEQRDNEMLARGLWLRSHQEPEKEMVVLWTGRAVLLTPDGEYREAV